MQMLLKYLGFALPLVGVFLFGAPGSAAPANTAPVLIGLDADMSGGSALGGEAIRRGALLAIAEINAQGGVLGRRLKLVVKDHRGVPVRGVDNMLDFAEMDNLVAVVGGIHRPVSLAQLKNIHRNRIIYLGPWAAGTPIVENGYSPNYVFRVSVRDQHAGGFLIKAARDRGFKKPGLLLWRTGWGRSNEKAMKSALKREKMQLAGVRWFNSSQKDMTVQIKGLMDAGADVIMLVANASDGLVAISDIAAFPENQRLPIISHWGITGGDFFKAGRSDIASVDLSFLQTFSFFAPPFPARARSLLKSYCSRFGPCASPADVTAPAGTAHAYDIVRILAQAIRKAGSIDRPKVRAAMENIKRFDGLMRNYRPPFTPQRHDALNADDFRLARFDKNGAIVPGRE
jgi:branched-chain amino acid transport system substrate-binding protein